MKAAIGQDSHRFEEGYGKPLILGGVVFPGETGLLANSDGDVVLHAITNAVSGITGRNILGRVADEMCQSGITDSAEYLREALKSLEGRIVHLSVSMECLRPKISPMIPAMREKIAELLGVESAAIGITATTGEGLTDSGGRTMRKVMEAAYAKVNLTLAVTGRRADGYHTIESLFQSVNLCDKLTLEQRERGFWLNETAGIPAEENIITRADRLLRREFPNLGGVAVTLEKNIPTQAGLGGGSTDAAAYLRGMDRLYGLGLGREGLRALAAELGADVPFCIDGGAAAAAGIGEKLTPVESHLPLWLVITKPKAGCSTPAMYRRIDEMGESLRQRFTTPEAAKALEKGDLAGLCGSLYNVFEEVTALPELSEIRQELRQSGALAAMMTGSGSAVFGIFPEEDAAKVAAEKMAESRWAICCRGINGPG